LQVEYRFYGIDSIDERCRLFFDEMQIKLAKEKIFQDVEGEEYMISVRDGLEQLVMSQISHLAFAVIAEKFREDDIHVIKRMKLLNFLTPEVLDINPDLFNESLLRLAGDELRKINSCVTPHDKIDCVVRFDFFFCFVWCFFFLSSFSSLFGICFSCRIG
jgi:nitrous oxide reductase